MKARSTALSYLFERGGSTDKDPLGGSTDKDAKAGSTVKVRRRSTIGPLGARLIRPPSRGCASRLDHRLLVTYLRGDKSIEPLGALWLLI